MKPKSKIALITGAGTNIGKASALALAKAGYTVVLAGRRKALLNQVARQAGPNALALATDLTDPRAIKALFAMIKARFGRLDVLFNNAGISADALPLENVPLAQWRAVIDTNVSGTFLCTQEAFRMMKAQRPRGGRIINNASISATVPRPDMAPYTITKHAITGLTKSASLEGRKYDIACGQIDIGNANDPKMKTRLARQADFSMKLEPIIDVKHVADMVVYMANLPLDANVQFVTVMATKMPFIGRG